ncbi:MAG: hypothetical protein RQ756_00970 [Flavobacteriaceae bacterium]|nr:hypothetical protein [Flavobacteriaceae bacterium]
MKFSFVLLTLFLLQQITAQQDNLGFYLLDDEARYDEVLKSAEENKVPVFINFSKAETCENCLNIDNAIVQDEVIGVMMQQNFLNIRIDPSTDFGMKKAAQFEVDKPNTIVVIDNTEKVFLKEVDIYASPFKNKLRNLLGYDKVLDKYRGTTYKSRSITENAEYALLVFYYDTKRAEDVAERILKNLTKDQLMNPQVLQVIDAYTTHNNDEQLVKLLQANSEDFVKTYDLESLKALSDKVLANRLVYAIDTKDFAYLEKSIEELVPLIANDETGIINVSAVTKMNYYAYMNQAEAYEKLLTETFIKNNTTLEENYVVAANNVFNEYPSSLSNIHALAFKWLDRQLQKEELWEAYYTYAFGLAVNNRMADARDKITKGKNLTTDEKQLNMFDELSKAIANP